MKEMYSVVGANPFASRRVPYGDDIDITEIKGKSSILGIVTNTFFGSENVVAYFIPFKVINTDYALKWALFGRKASKNALKLDKYAIEVLSQYFGKYMTHQATGLYYFGSVYDFDPKNKNSGKSAESQVANILNGKLTSAKMDNVYKVDIIAKSYIQLKTSIVFPGNHGSAGTTNGRATV
jgi:hypothetical protein